MNAITFTLLTATEGRPRLTSDTSRSTNTEGTRWTNTSVSSESSDDSLITKCIPIRSTSHWNVLNSLISSPNNVTSIGGETGEDLMRGFALEVWLLLPPSNSSMERNPSQVNSKTGHFRFAPSLCFKARLSATLLIWTWFFYYRANKTHFYKKGFAFNLLLKVRVSGTRKCPITIWVIKPLVFYINNNLFS